ncbi:hypothetical protein [Streptomyces sp. NPDC000410]|uniref:hypothetical protein n=1 Tax=Streptomyces sp. NPDC000410 TaxID=3154254 RepID=UPI00331DE52D
MTRTPSLATPAPPAAPAIGRGRRALRALTIASCLPYLSLKIAWISGSRIGIPEGSVLLREPGMIAVANGVTVLMDACVVVLALLLTRPWGRHVKAWLLTVPMWTATGLLVPIMVGFPIQLLLSLGDGSLPQDSKEPFLHDWVFSVVYGGFIVQGLTLGTLFALYARERWGHLWRGTVWELPTTVTGPLVRSTAVAGSLLALFPAVMHLLWASGSTAGLSPLRAAQRTTDFYVLAGVHVLFPLAAAAGALLLAFRPAPSLPVRTPLGLAWVGSACLGAWGGWMLLATLMPDIDPENAATGLMTLTYAGEMITGLFLAATTASVLRRRAA